MLSIVTDVCNACPSGYSVAKCPSARMEYAVLKTRDILPCKIMSKYWVHIKTLVLADVALLHQRMWLILSKIL